MKNKDIDREPPFTGALTVPMDFNSEEYKMHRKILDERINSMSPEEKRDMELIRMKYRIKNYLEAKITEDNIITAGQFLRMYLEKLNIKQNRFAEGIGMKPANLSKLLSGQRKINIEQSLLFGHLFNADPKVWLMVQLKNDYIRMAGRKPNYTDLNLRQFAMGA